MRDHAARVNASSTDQTLYRADRFREVVRFFDCKTKGEERGAYVARPLAGYAV